jgi:hypothetical protein
MAETITIHKLRRLLQDFYDADGVQLSASDQAFADDEIADLYDNALLEVQDIAPSSSSAGALAINVAKADGLLMLAQDAARRHKWEVNNKVVDEDNISEKLVSIAREIRLRYQEHQRIRLKKELEDLSTPDVTPGSTLVFNNTVDAHRDRNFGGNNVKRNQARF